MPQLDIVSISNSISIFMLFFSGNSIYIVIIPIYLFFNYFKNFTYKFFKNCLKFISIYRRKNGQLTNF